MNIEIRVYKRYDMDLFALYDAGYPLADMMYKAVAGFAHRQPVRFLTERPVFFDANDKSTFRTRFTVPNSDTATIALLKTIKHGCRSNFCKAVLREALIHQNLTAYFATSADMSLFDSMNDIDPTLFSEAYIVSRNEQNKTRGRRTKAYDPNICYRCISGDDPQEDFSIAKDHEMDYNEKRKSNKRSHQNTSARNFQPSASTQAGHDHAEETRTSAPHPAARRRRFVASDQDPLYTQMPIQQEQNIHTDVRQDSTRGQDGMYADDGHTRQNQNGDVRQTRAGNQSQAYAGRGYDRQNVNVRQDDMWDREQTYADDGYARQNRGVRQDGMYDQKREYAENRYGYKNDGMRQDGRMAGYTDQRTSSQYRDVPHDPHDYHEGTVPQYGDRYADAHPGPGEAMRTTANPYSERPGERGGASYEAGRGYGREYDDPTGRMPISSIGSIPYPDDGMRNASGYDDPFADLNESNSASDDVMSSFMDIMGDD